MKLKHSAVLALAVWLCVVAWVGAMIVSKPTVFTGYASDEDGAAAAQLQQQVLHNTRMQEALASLASPPATVVAGPIVAPAPLAPVGADGMASGDAAGAGMHTVSLIISSDRMQRAVIDGELVRRGSRLGDGSRVRGIGSNWVRIEDPSGRLQTLSLRSPYVDAIGAQREVRR